MAKKEVQGIPTKISATSRCAIKIRDNFYTIEASEERLLPGKDVDPDLEWSALFDEVNTVVDNQMNEILDTFGKK